MTVNGKRVAVLIAGLTLAIMGIGIVVAGVEAMINGHLQDGQARTVLYVGLGMAVVGAYLVDPVWLKTFANTCVSYLPGHSQQQPPAGP